MVDVAKICSYCDKRESCPELSKPSGIIDCDLIYAWETLSAESHGSLIAKLLLSAHTQQKDENGCWPCPHCGGTNLRIGTGRELFHDDSDCWTVCCDYNSGGCGATAGYRGTREEAIESWNTGKR